MTPFADSKHTWTWIGKMIDGVSERRFAEMTDREKRWLDNVKKAFFASDRAYINGEMQDRCFPELCNAVDTAKTLQRSLRDEDTSMKDNKKRFIEFFGGPHPADGGYESGELVDARTEKRVRYSLGGIVYAIRCMVHENENLNVTEQPDYHILLDWSESQASYVLANQYADEKVVLNAHVVLTILRRRVATFVTGIDSAIALLQTGTIHITCEPELGSIRPGENFVLANLES